MSCETEEIVFTPQTGSFELSLSFDDEGNKLGKSSVAIEVDYDIARVGELTNSENHIDRISAVDEKTGISVIGYVLSEKFYSDNQIGRMKYKIYSGYGFDGECFVFGTFIEGDSGNTIFIEANAATKASGHPDVCGHYA